MINFGEFFFALPYEGGRETVGLASQSEMHYFSCGRDVWSREKFINNDKNKQMHEYSFMSYLSVSGVMTSRSVQPRNSFW